jgi:predicted transcriptional regulator
MLEKLKHEVELLGRHLEVVRVVMEHQPIGIMKLADILNIPYHRVRYSLRVLEQLGYIRASPAGAVTTPLTNDVLENLDKEIDEIIEELRSLKERNIHNL